MTFILDMASGREYRGDDMRAARGRPTASRETAQTPHTETAALQLFERVNDTPVDPLPDAVRSLYARALLAKSTD